MEWQSRHRHRARAEERRLAALREALRRPGRELVLQHLGRGHEYRIAPDGIQVRDEDAAALIRRRYVRVRSAGLFFDTAQTWTADHD
jgi:hypothetical protein